MAEAIKVAVRCRPFNQREKDLGSSLVVSMSGKDTIVKDENGKPKTFTYDFSYWSHSTDDPNYASQDTVMQDIGTVILENATKGFNGCLFAYGQTGAGKSYSVMGYPDAPGIVPRSVQAIFEHQKQLGSANEELRIWIAFIEIYNEQVRDLLHPGTETTEMKVMDHPQLGVYIPGLTEAPCKEVADVDKLMEFGTKKRVTAATQMNATSSRSHAVFAIKVQRLEGAPPEEGKKDERKALNAKINLVDLAGSERSSKTGAEGSTLKEGCAINQSLTALGMVIKELSEAMAKMGSKKGKKGDLGAVVPFRASKLTFLLKDSLAGNSKTYMIAAISPASDNCEETIGTLRFAASVKKIKTVATKNVDKKDEMINNLQAELKKLKAMAGGGGGGGGGGGDPAAISEEVAERERLLEEMNKTYQAQLEESKAVESARDDALKDMGLDSSEIDEVFGLQKDTPYLANMNDDPSLAGCLMYFLKPGIVTTIGSSKENAISLQGLGITEHLCQIDNTDNRTVTITIAPASDTAGAKPRVCVNGSLLNSDQSRRLKHNDKIFLGRAYAFKLVLPAMARMLGTAESMALAEDLHEMDLIKSLACEDSEAWGELQLYLEDLWQRLGEERGRELFEHLSEASHLADEANDITAEMRPEERLKFEVELVWDIHRDARDIIVIRVLQFPQDATDANVLYYWTLNEFKERLDCMRDCYDTFHNKGVFDGKGDCVEDPWMEASITELKHRLHKHIDSELIKKDQAKQGNPPPGGSSPSPAASSVSAKASAAAAAAVSSARTRTKAPAPRRPGMNDDPSPVANGPPLGGSVSASNNVPTNGVGSASAKSFGTSSNSPPIDLEMVSATMREQLKDKQDKEELYKSRISLLQQQISLYEQHAQRKRAEEQGLRRTPQSAPSLAPAPDRDVLIEKPFSRSYLREPSIPRSYAREQSVPRSYVRELSPAPQPIVYVQMARPEVLLPPQPMHFSPLLRPCSPGPMTSNGPQLEQRWVSSPGY